VCEKFEEWTTFSHPSLSHPSLQYRAKQAQNCPRRGSAAARSESPAWGAGAVYGAYTRSYEGVAGGGDGAFVAAAPRSANSRTFVLYRALR